MVTSFAGRLSSAANALHRAAATSLRRLRGQSDYQRWGQREALFGAWDERTRLIGSQVPAGSRVLEFGAGRMALRNFLPEGCAYTPSDLVDRGPGTLVCDLNGAALPDFGRYDVAVFSGVLEYVHDVPRLVSHLAGSVDTIIASYASREANGRNRRAHGWVNDYTSHAFLRLFEHKGFECKRALTWRSQIVCVFGKREGA